VNIFSIWFIIIFTEEREDFNPGIDMRVGDNCAYVKSKRILVMISFLLYAIRFFAKFFNKFRKCKKVLLIDNIITHKKKK
jgi:hypothetical protein